MFSYTAWAVHADTVSEIQLSRNIYGNVNFHSNTPPHSTSAPTRKHIVLSELNVVIVNIHQLFTGFRAVHIRVCTTATINLMNTIYSRDTKERV